MFRNIFEVGWDLYFELKDDTSLFFEVIHTYFPRAEQFIPFQDNLFQMQFQTNGLKKFINVFHSVLKS